MPFVVRNILGNNEKMKEINEKMQKNKRICLKSCHNDGKERERQQNIVQNAKTKIVNILLILNFDIV